MKHLKRFNDLNESHIEKCKRCESPTDYKTSWSYFNGDEICMKCVEVEKKDPDYEDCRAAEAEAIKNGDYNYHYIPNYKPIVRKGEDKIFNEMVEIPKTWTRKEKTKTFEDIDDIFFEYKNESSDIKVETDSYAYLNKEGELSEYIVLEFIPNMKFDFTNLNAIKKGKYFLGTKEFADTYNHFLRWASDPKTGEGFTVHTKIITSPYEITTKDGKIRNTNPTVKVELNKCQKMVGREIRKILVIGYKKLSENNEN